MRLRTLIGEEAATVVWRSMKRFRLKAPFATRKVTQLGFTPTSLAKGRGQLVLLSMAVTWIWLVVLPWVGRWESVERHRRLLEERRIDASAMFYTELEPRPVD